jgi:hypothetical protein
MREFIVICVTNLTGEKFPDGKMPNVSCGFVQGAGMGAWITDNFVSLDRPLASMASRVASKAGHRGTWGLGNSA